MQPPSLLEKLPIELIYEIQLYALNESLPIVKKRAHEIFRSTHATYRAEYIFLRYLARSRTSPFSSANPSYTQGELVSYALTYPLCTSDVLEALVRLIANDLERGEEHLEGPKPFLPKRLFKHLGPRTPPARYTHTDEPLPFLRYLYDMQSRELRAPDTNAHDGYALSRAVHAGHIDLVRFLLHHGARPNLKDALAVRIAIRKKDLKLVQMLIEREPEEEYAYVRSCQYQYPKPNKSSSEAPENERRRAAESESESESEMTKKRRKSAKRRRMMDRVQVTTAMLHLAVETDARDIVQYLLEKGARPDMTTIQRMRRIGSVGSFDYASLALQSPPRTF